MKKVFALFLSLLLLVSLASCGKNGGDAPPRQDVSQSEPPDSNPGPDTGDDSPFPDPGNTGNDSADTGWNSGTVTTQYGTATLKCAGDTFQMPVLDIEDAYTRVFSSDDPDVASVDEETGEITAVAPGQTTVSARIKSPDGWYNFHCTVRCAWAEVTSGEELLASLPAVFDFLSGAGGWSTQLRIAADGSFTGYYHDFNAGGADNLAEIYYCNFSGTFSTPVQVDGYTYSMKLESLELEEEPGQERIDYNNRTRYISSTPYGLEDVDEVLVFLPGMDVAELPESFVAWTHYYIGDSEVLPFYGL